MMLAALVTRYSRLCLILSLLIISIFSVFALQVKTESNVDCFTLINHPDEQFYQQFKAVFGNDEFFIIAFEKKETIFTAENLLMLKQMTADIEKLDYVKEVKSLANVDEIVGSQDDFYISSFLDQIPVSSEALKERKNAAVTNKLYCRNLISPDARTAALIVKVLDRFSGKQYRQHLINQVKNVLAGYKANGIICHLAGWTVTNYSLSRYMKKDMTVFVPLTYVFIMIAVWFFFRNGWLVLLALANITACLVSTMGVFSLSGVAINNVTIIVIPLVMALSLSDTVHIFSQLGSGEKKYPHFKGYIAGIIGRVYLPCLLTTVTTAVGFLSLAVNDLAPIRQFAWLAAAGMVFEFFYSFFLLPPLMMCLPLEKICQSVTNPDWLDSALHRITKMIISYSRLIIAASVLLLVIAGFYTLKLKVETNIMHFFKHSTRVRQDIDFVEKRLAGVGTLEISLQAAERDAFKMPANLAVIEAIETYADSIKKVDTTISAVDFIKEMNQAFHNENPAFYSLPPTREYIAQYLLLYDSDDLAEYMSEGYDHARIAIRLAEHSSRKQAEIIAQLRKYIQSLDVGELQVRITGRVLHAVNTIDALVRGQVNSLLVAALVIAVIMMLVMKTFSIGMLSLVPNAFPLIINIGLMGFLGIPLNTATALISTVALGIAVDDTIHFLSAYTDERARGCSVIDAVALAIKLKGRAMISTSLIIAIGFLVMCSSQFMPTVHFGFLSAIIMITALLADLFLLPALLVGFSKVEVDVEG